MCGARSLDRISIADWKFFSFEMKLMLMRKQNVSFPVHYSSVKIFMTETDKKMFLYFVAVRVDTFKSSSAIIR